MWLLWSFAGLLLVIAIFVLGAMYGKKIEQRVQLEASKLKSEASAAAKRFP